MDTMEWIIGNKLIRPAYSCTNFYVEYQVTSFFVKREFTSKHVEAVSKSELSGVVGLYLMHEQELYSTWFSFNLIVGRSFVAQSLLV